MSENTAIPPKKIANALRFLSVDAINVARSGHPGAPLGMADFVSILFQKFLKHNPKDPSFPNRDRLILSNGHASSILYSALHLSGYDLTLEDLQSFRKLHSKTPGHPENTTTPGVEVSTGPLGQGLAMAVGMAMAERLLSEEFNKPKHKIIDHKTYAIVGDGCLMEGISHEAISLAGVFKLSKLVVLYDANDISIEGPIAPWMNEDVKKRFEACHWRVIGPLDGHDETAIESALTQAQLDQGKPTLIIFKTKIGYGSLLEGSEKTHGAPLGSEQRSILAKNLHWDYSPFEIPEDIYQAFDAKEKGELLSSSFTQAMNAYQTSFPEEAKALQERLDNHLLVGLADKLSALSEEAQEIMQDEATRQSSSWVLNEIAPEFKEILGGSADLSGSNLTLWKGAKLWGEKGAQYVQFGVREFGMYAILNGVAAHGGFVPFAGTFLVFIDYAKAALRLSALMQKRVIYVLTHDSIGVGEDGPTHQPIEQLATLRSIPNHELWRPCDRTETVVSWQQAFASEKAPTSLSLSRQKLKACVRSSEQVMDIAKGGYLLQETEGHHKITLIASGSEISLALALAQNLEGARVVSMPSLCRFLKQSETYQEKTLGDAPIFIIEASSDPSWYQLLAGRKGLFYGLKSFGESASPRDVANFMKMDIASLIQSTKLLLSK